MNEVRALARLLACVLCLVVLTPLREAAAGSSPPPAAGTRAGLAGASAPASRDAAEIAAPGPGALPPPGIRQPPYHGRPDLIAFGGEFELRFARDRLLGVSHPDWLSMVRAGGFATARLHRRLRLVGQAAWDRSPDALLVERALLEVRLGQRLTAHGGILLLPLGRTNPHPHALQSEFTERSLVATGLVGVPCAQLGAGVRGFRSAGSTTILSYEVDVVAGYGEGLISDSPDGTRLPRGRNNYGDNNDVPALVARMALHPSPGTEFGLAALGGSYNTTRFAGLTVDVPRYLLVSVADGAGTLGHFRLAGEAGLVLVDVPPGLQGLFARRQWGASLEAVHPLREPLRRTWRGSSLAAAVRAEAVDWDLAVAGDSRSRVATSLNLRPGERLLFRLGWFYELRRDRFNNQVPAAGLTLGIAGYL